LSFRAAPRYKCEGSRGTARHRPKGVKLTERLFTYGTLRRGSSHPLSRTLASAGSYLGTGRLRGELYDLGGYPGAVAGNSDGGWIVGDMYRVHRPHQLWSVLDEYEDCDRAAPDGGEYRRVVCPIETEPGTALACWVYVYNRPTRGFNRIPGGDYFRGAEHGPHARPETERPDRV
jgi:gamma-glutamylcyclotransferase (GGCT)/AIG2-like uncharacterized protein YtfP